MFIETNVSLLLNKLYKKKKKKLEVYAVCDCHRGASMCVKVEFRPHAHVNHIQRLIAFRSYFEAKTTIITKNETKTN